MSGKRLASGCCSVVLFILLVAALTVLLRRYLFDVVTVQRDVPECGLLRGDRLVIDQWSYHYRTQPERGDYAVFRCPPQVDAQHTGGAGLLAGRIMALPGDTIWFGQEGAVALSRSYAHGCIWPFVIPARGMQVHMGEGDSLQGTWGMALYARVISRHEQGTAPYHRFQHDYYWMQSGGGDDAGDSRYVGPVPRECLTGRARMILYSLNDSLPWTRRLRPGRLFLAR